MRGFSTCLPWLCECITASLAGVLLQASHPSPCSPSTPQASQGTFWPLLRPCGSLPSVGPKSCSLGPPVHHSIGNALPTLPALLCSSRLFGQMAESEPGDQLHTAPEACTLYAES